MCPALVCFCFPRVSCYVFLVERVKSLLTDSLHSTQLKVFIKETRLFLQIWEIKFYCFKDTRVPKICFNFLNAFFSKYPFGNGNQVSLEMIKKGLLVLTSCMFWGYGLVMNMVVLG